MRRPTQCWLSCRHACWISCLKQFQSFRLWQQPLYCIALIMWMYLRLAWFLRVSVFFSKIKHLVFLCSSVCFSRVFLLYTYASCYWNLPCEFLTEISSCRILNEIVSFVTDNYRSILAYSRTNVWLYLQCTQSFFVITVWLYLQHWQIPLLVQIYTGVACSNTIYVLLMVLTLFGNRLWFRKVSQYSTTSRQDTP